MLRYTNMTKWEDWSLTVTKGVQCLEVNLNNIPYRFECDSEWCHLKRWDVTCHWCDRVHMTFISHPCDCYFTLGMVGYIDCLSLNVLQIDTTTKVNLDSINTDMLGFLEKGKRNTSCLKDLGTFWNTKQNVHRFTLNLTVWR